MAKILEELIDGKISLAQLLDRVYVICLKLKNGDLANWCYNEINGYKKEEDLPEYRKVKSYNVFYTGINVNTQISNMPLPESYLSYETLEKIKQIDIFENISEVEIRKNEKATMYRDLTWLGPEVAKNTKEFTLGYGVQCVSISQHISPEFYSNIYQAVKLRIINLIMSFENSGVDVDTLDIIKSSKTIDLTDKNKMLFESVIINGNTYEPKKNSFRITYLRPILIGTISGLLATGIGAILVWLFKH